MQKPINPNTQNKRQPLNRRLRWGASLLIVTFLFAGLGGLVYKNWKTIVSYEWGFHPIPLLISFLLYSVALILAARNWGYMINYFSKNPGWEKHFRIYITTNLAQRLPGVFLHVIGRTVLYKRLGISGTAVALVSGLEFSLMAVSGILVSFLTVPTLIIKEIDNPIILFVGLVVLLFFLHPKVLFAIIYRLRKTDRNLPSQINYTQLMIWVINYVTIWFMGGLILFFVINTVYPIEWNQLIQIVGVWSLSGTVAMIATFSPSGLGIREITLSFLLSSIIPPGITVVIAIFLRIILTLFEMVCALLMIYREPAFLKNINSNFLK